MNKVDWSKAPEGATFYAKSCFRNNFGDWWCSWRGAGDWETSVCYSLEELLEANDYEPKPDTTEDFRSTDSSAWTASHYDNYYQLTPEDIEVGKIKIDAYFVNKIWKLNQKDDTGGLFHSLKTIARFGDKNPIERELKALYAQTKRMAELYGIKLE